MLPGAFDTDRLRANFDGAGRRRDITVEQAQAERRRHASPAGKRKKNERSPI